MQREGEFLILCARHSLRGEEQDGLRELAGGALDWGDVIALSGWHGIVSLVYRSLQSACPDVVPADALARLRHLHFVNSARALFLASELSRILAAFEKREVPAYPFKGPALSAMLYGDPMQRQSVDLDIIVPYAAVRDAMDVLATLGYVKSNRHENVKLSAFRHVDYEIPFSRNDGKLNIELQWAIVPPYFGFREAELKIWEKRRTMRANGFSFPVLPPEETLVALCVHGAKHLWHRMGWVCDVAKPHRGPRVVGLGTAHRTCPALPRPAHPASRAAPRPGAGRRRPAGGGVGEDRRGSHGRRAHPAGAAGGPA